MRAACLVLGLALGLITPAASAPGMPEDLLERVRKAYASLTSYADAGSVTVEYGAASVSRHTFRTFYRAPRQFLFEFNEDPADGGARVAVWCDGGDFQSWWSDTGIHNVYPKGEGASAFVFMAPQTSGAVTQIASLVFPGGGLVSTLTELAELRPAGTDIVNGRKTRKLVGVARSAYQTGTVVNVRRTSVWIDGESGMILRILEDSTETAPAGTRMRITTTFSPQINPVLDNRQFTFQLPARPRRGGEP